MSLGTQATTQTTTQNLSPEQKKLMALAMPGLETYAAHPPQLPTSPLVAGFNPAQESGQQQVLGATGAQGDIAGSAKSGQQFLLDKALYPGTNPALQGTIDAAVRPITENFRSSVLPSIRNEAAGTGNFGGSRQGVAEGIASRGYLNQVGDTSAKVANEGYQGGLDAMVKSLGLVPSTQSAQLAPGVSTSGVGDVQQNLSQNQLNEAAYRSLYQQQLPFLTASDLASIGSGLPGGSVTSKGTQPSQSILSTGLGLGSLLLGSGGIGPLLAML